MPLQLSFNTKNRIVAAVEAGKKTRGKRWRMEGDRPLKD